MTRAPSRTLRSMAPAARAFTMTRSYGSTVPVAYTAWMAVPRTTGEVVTGAGRSFTAAPAPERARASAISTTRAPERFVRGTNRGRAGAEVARGTPRSEAGAEGSSAGRVIV